MHRHTITDDGIPEAEQAVRDILFLYRDAIDEYVGFGHNLETGTFDPFKFLTCTVDEPEGYSFGFDLQLLHEGAAVALLCKLSDYVDDCGPDGIEYIQENYLRLCTSSEDTFQVTIAKIRKALDDRLFSGVPLAQEAVAASFTDEEELFREKLADVYRTYIVGYFQRLLSNV